MLQHFFAVEVDGQSTAGLFDGLEISKHSECMQHQGKYPVIFLTFKDVKELTYRSAINGFADLIKDVYSEWSEILLKSDKINNADKSLIEDTLKQNLSEDKLKRSFKNLVKMVATALGQRVYILIDEYDVAIQESYSRRYYDKLIPFMRGFLGSALKDNSSVKQSILTGVLRVSKESLFSDLNNVEIYSILNSGYSKYFGFTEEEVNELLTKAKLPANTKQTKEWFNGYNFGGTTIYNPWSIIKFIKEQGTIDVYWVNTSGNELIKDLLTKSEVQTQDKIGNLIAGKPVKEIVDEHIVFQDLQKNRAAIWSLLLMSGYLKAVSSSSTEYGKLCELAIPNKEVEFLYKQIFREWLSGNRGIIWYQELLSSLTEGRIEEFEHKLQDAIMQMASYYDTCKNTQEIFYQGLMLGILSGLKDNYEIKSNRESGLGRYDLMIIPKDINKLGIVMEFKVKTDKDKESLEKLAARALGQIKKSKYITELQARGVSNICSLGIAFSGKDLKVVK